MSNIDSSFKFPFRLTTLPDRDSSGLTTLAAISGIGSVAGAIAAGLRVTPPTMSRAAGLVAAFGGSFAVFGLAPTWLLTLLSSVVLGVTSGP